MIHFEYNNTSTLDRNLILADFDNKDSLDSGLSREILKGDTTSARYTANHLGSKFTNVITFTKALVKSDETAFTRDELSSIAGWLTSPRYPKPLKVTYENGKTIYYEGLFTNLQYKTAAIGVIGIIFTFTNNSPFCYIEETKTYILAENGSIEFECHTDCLEDYCFPAVSLKYNGTENSHAVITFTNENISNSSHSVSYKCLSSLNYMIDNEKRMLSSTISDSLNYNEIGWNSDGDIGWLRLVSGTNTFDISSTAYPVTITITNKTPKKLGELYDY